MTDDAYARSLRAAQIQSELREAASEGTLTSERLTALTQELYEVAPIYKMTDMAGTWATYLSVTQNSAAMDED